MNVDGSMAKGEIKEQRKQKFGPDFNLIYTDIINGNVTIMFLVDVAIQFTVLLAKTPTWFEIQEVFKDFIRYKNLMC